MSLCDCWWRLTSTGCHSNQTAIDISYVSEADAEASYHNVPCCAFELPRRDVIGLSLPAEHTFRCRDKPIHLFGGMLDLDDSTCSSMPY